jgi:hypothetical protein
LIELGQFDGFISAKWTFEYYSKYSIQLCSTIARKWGPHFLQKNATILSLGFVQPGAFGNLKHDWRRIDYNCKRPFPKLVNHSGAHAKWTFLRHWRWIASS